ncbi:hypothetical protein PTI45_00465 [Paenibacillus nuruki]|uniref:Uncharacterized protein n=1 Tax=Paenibacillus nuruki TaxID=1886670 RepID=A0A1E3L884_9BACL|nr:hypothetical protein [Paenibacillus nuruki]ODP30012.1 hypothetical protein PTI45_00465 [Paenibacillus nuruki]
MRFNKMALNLVLCFLTGLLAFYIVARTITITAIFVSLVATGIIALGYFVAYLLKKRKLK